MKKPIILLTGHWEPFSPSFSAPFMGLYFHYYEAVVRAGGTPILVPYCADLDDFVEFGDGLILTGGYDVETSYYGEEPRYNTVKGTIERDEHEKALYEKWDKTNKPLFGICRGLQFLNVVLGGTLIQDIPVECGVIHSATQHPVKVVEGCRMSDWYGAADIVTNSFHHQGIKRLAEDLIVTARSEDGMIEGVEHKEKPYFAVQYHPERMIADWKIEGLSNMSGMFSSFIELCK